MAAYTAGFMASITCGPSADDRDQFRNPTLVSSTSLRLSLKPFSLATVILHLQIFFSLSIIRYYYITYKLSPSFSVSKVGGHIASQIYGGYDSLNAPPSVQLTMAISSTRCIYRKTATATELYRLRTGRANINADRSIKTGSCGTVLTISSTCTHGREKYGDETARCRQRCSSQPKHARYYKAIHRYIHCSNRAFSASESTDLTSLRPDQPTVPM